MLYNRIEKPYYFKTFIILKINENNSKIVLSGDGPEQTLVLHATTRASLFRQLHNRDEKRGDQIESVSANVSTREEV